MTRWLGGPPSGEVGHTKHDMQRHASPYPTLCECPAACVRALLPLCSPFEPGSVKLADFGTAKVITKAYQNASLAGTVRWMSPEAIQQIDCPASDLWSSGCTVLEMLTGDVPWAQLGHHATEFQIFQQIFTAYEGPPLPNSRSVTCDSFLGQVLAFLRASSRSMRIEKVGFKFVGGNFGFRIGFQIFRIFLRPSGVTGEQPWLLYCTSSGIAVMQTGGGGGGMSVFLGAC